MKTNKAKSVLLPMVVIAVVSLCLTGCKTSHEDLSEHPEKAPAAPEHPTTP